MMTDPFATELFTDPFANIRYEQLDKNFTPINVTNHDVDQERLNLSHYAMCLLRKADPASVSLTIIKLYYHVSGRLVRKAWAIKFTIPPNIRFEVKYVLFRSYN